MEIYEAVRRVKRDSDLFEWLNGRVTTGEKMNKQKHAFADVLNKEHGFKDIKINETGYASDLGVVFAEQAIDKVPEEIQKQLKKQPLRTVRVFRKNSDARKELLAVAKETGMAQATSDYSDVNANVGFAMAEFSFTVGHSPKIQFLNGDWFIDISSYSDEDLKNKVFEISEAFDYKTYRDLAIAKLQG